MIYSWAKGASFTADANKVGQELEELDKVSIDSVLNKARNPNTELNKCFIWDDSEAAEKYRRHQASMLISTIKVEIQPVNPSTEPVVVRSYESIKTNNDRHFVFTPKAISKPDETAMILSRIMRDIKSLEKNLQDYKSILTPEIKARVENLLGFFS